MALLGSLHFRENGYFFSPGSGDYYGFVGKSPHMASILPEVETSNKGITNTQGFWLQMRMECGSS